MSFVSRRRGQAFLEAAVCLPIILLLIFGVIFFGNAWARRVKVTNAARFAAWGQVRVPAQETNADQLKTFFGLDNVVYGGTSGSGAGGEGRQQESLDEIHGAGSGAGAESRSIMDAILSFPTGSTEATIGSVQEAKLLKMIGRGEKITIKARHVCSGTALTRKQTGGIFNILFDLVKEGVTEAIKDMF